MTLLAVLTTWESLALFLTVKTLNQVTMLNARILSIKLLYTIPRIPWLMPKRFNFRRRKRCCWAFLNTKSTCWVKVSFWSTTVSRYLKLSTTSTFCPFNFICIHLLLSFLLPKISSLVLLTLTNHLTCLSAKSTEKEKTRFWMTNQGHIICILDQNKNRVVTSVFICVNRK